MSVYALERVLFELAAGGPGTADYLGDREAYLAEHGLEAHERRLILDMDVNEMIQRGINAMLVMRAFTAVEGRDRMPEYMRRLKHLPRGRNDRS
jgi:hypothetical protein